MIDAIETAEYGGFTATVYIDECSDNNPRDYEGESVFFGFHRAYASPDPAPDSDAFESRRMMRNPNLITLPVWLYDHSGTCYRASEANPFHCPWDSGLFGYIYISRADARKRFGVSRITKGVLKRVLESLQGEVETYSAWANGDVYRYEVTDAQGDVVDSCGGFVGESDYAFSEACDAAKTLFDESPDQLSRDLVALKEGRA